MGDDLGLGKMWRVRAHVREALCLVIAAVLLVLALAVATAVSGAPACRPAPTPSRLSCTVPARHGG